MFDFKFQIIRERIYPHKSSRESIIWNSHPGGLLTRPGYSDSFQDFPFNFALPSPILTMGHTSLDTISYASSYKLQSSTNGRDCPPSGCENENDKMYEYVPQNGDNEDSDINEDYNKVLNSYLESEEKGFVSSLSLAQEHRKLLGLARPFKEDPSNPNNHVQSLHPSLSPSYVRKRAGWNSTLKGNGDSDSRFTAVIFTQLSGASPVVQYNAPIFKLVSNVAACSHVDKVSIPKIITRRSVQSSTTHL